MHLYYSLLASLGQVISVERVYSSISELRKSTKHGLATPLGKTLYAQSADTNPQKPIMKLIHKKLLAPNAVQQCGLAAAELVTVRMSQPPAGVQKGLFEPIGFTGHQ